MLREEDMGDPSSEVPSGRTWQMGVVGGGGLVMKAAIGLQMVYH